MWTVKSQGQTAVSPVTWYSSVRKYSDRLMSTWDFKRAVYFRPAEWSNTRFPSYEYIFDIWYIYDIWLLMMGYCPGRAKYHSLGRNIRIDCSLLIWRPNDYYMSVLSGFEFSVSSGSGKSSHYWHQTKRTTRAFCFHTDFHHTRI